MQHFSEDTVSTVSPMPEPVSDEGPSLPGNWAMVDSHRPLIEAEQCGVLETSLSSGIAGWLLESSLGKAAGQNTEFLDTLGCQTNTE